MRKVFREGSKRATDSRPRRVLPKTKPCGHLGVRELFDDPKTYGVALRLWQPLEGWDQLRTELLQSRGADELLQLILARLGTFNSDPAQRPSLDSAPPPEHRQLTVGNPVEPCRRL